MNACEAIEAISERIVVAYSRYLEREMEIIAGTDAADDDLVEWCVWVDAADGTVRCHIGPTSEHSGRPGANFYAAKVGDIREAIRRAREVVEVEV